jgi:hypothetical protein
MALSLVNIQVQYQFETDAAVCVREEEDGPDIWIPKSRFEIDEAAPLRGEYVQLTTDVVMAYDKGLI